MTGPVAVKSLSGPALRDLFTAAATWLEINREQVNAINVFPVPDGDTGTNMHLTMRSTLEEASRSADDSAGGMMAAVARGALMGARGNSGVILSQILRGMAQAMDGADAVDAGLFAKALNSGADAAYKAVTKPAEGTILTVIRETAAECGASSGDDVDLAELLATAVRVAGESVERTPTLLPVLAEAGVVDAGGKGLLVLLEGMLKHLRGEALEAPESAAGTVEHEWLSGVEQRHALEESPYGYCTEVLVEGRGLDVDGMREAILELGDSALVVGDERMVRVHVHTDDPGAVLSQGTAAGALVQVKVDNIKRQAERFVEMHHEDDTRPAPDEEVGDSVVSVVAVASGEGLADVFRDMGCLRVVSGGPTMNPSTREILDAIESCPAPEVIVLPNDKNIIMAAEQAVPLSSKKVGVVKSRSIPQGIAALLAMNPEMGIDDNAGDMEQALGLVRTVEITRAVRSTSIGGVKVSEGQIIAIVDDVLTLSAETAEEAAVQALRGLATESTSLVSLYYGAETTPEQADDLAERLKGELAGHNVEVYWGGQPHYQYIISIE